MTHFQRWGALYIFTILFGSSWIGQMLTQDGSWTEFWASTFENWQSEFLQLGVQALLLSAFVGYVFTKGNEDINEIKTELRHTTNSLIRIERKLGDDHG